ncbi:MAG: SAF domain-containing protein, partial [Halothece sp.]
RLDQMKRIFEKSIVAAFDIKSGTTITKGHLAFKKPGNGINAKNYNEIVGKQLNIDIKKDEQFNYEMFK